MAGRQYDLPDIVATGLRVIFVGMSAGRQSWQSGHYYANRSNCFWQALYKSGFIPRELRPEEDTEVLDHGVGLTDVIKDKWSGPTAGRNRPPTDADRDRISRLVSENPPETVAILGKDAFLALTGEWPATWGLQEARVAGVSIYLLASTSWRNRSSYSPEQIAAHFTHVRSVLDRSATGAGSGAHGPQSRQQTPPPDDDMTQTFTDEIVGRFASAGRARYSTGGTLQYLGHDSSWIRFRRESGSEGRVPLVTVRDAVRMGLRLGRVPTTTELRAVVKGRVQSPTLALLLLLPGEAWTDGRVSPPFVPSQGQEGPGVGNTTTGSSDAQAEDDEDAIHKRANGKLSAKGLHKEFRNVAFEEAALERYAALDPRRQSQCRVVFGHLDRGQAPPHKKPLTGMVDVFEVDCSKRGRVYCKPDGRRWRVLLVGDKNSQNRDLRWLRKNSGS